MRLALEAGYQRRRHRRVPLRARQRQFSLHGGQHAPPGRAPRDRGGHRRRPRAAAAARRRRRHARGRPAAAARPRHRGPPQRRGPGPRLLARRRAASRCCASRPGRASASTPASPRATPCRAEFDSMIAKIIAHGDTREQAIARLRRAVADTMVDDRGGHHQPGLPARAARPRRAAQGRGRHRLARPPAGRGRGAADAPRRRRARAGRDRALRRTPPPTSARASTRSRAAAARTPTPTSAARSTCCTAAPAIASSVCQIAPRALPRRGRRRAHRGDRRAAHRARAPPHLRRALLPHRDRAAGRRPARRGQRRAAPRLARRGRPDPQPRPGRRRRDPGLRRRRGAGRRRRRGHRVDEDGELADRDRPRARARGARLRQLARRRPASRCCRSTRSTRRRAATRASACASSSTTTPTSATALARPRVARARLRRHARRGRARARSGARRRPRRRAPPARALRRRPHAQPPARRRASTTRTTSAARRSTCTRSCARSTPSAEGLPDRFVAHLERALAHYGIEGLERTAALEDAAYRLFLSQQRAATAREAVRGVLARHLERGDTLERRRPSAPCSTAWRPRSRRASRRSPSSPARCAGAAATSRGLAAGARGDLRGDGRRTCAALAEGPAGDRDAHMAALVDCPQPLAAAAEPPRRRRRPAGRGDDAPLLPDPHARGGRAAAGRGRPVRARRPTSTRACATTSPPPLAEPDDLPRGAARARRARRARCPRASGCWPTSTRCAPPTRTSPARCSPRPSCRPRVEPRRVRARRRERRRAHVRARDGEEPSTDLRGMHPMMAERMDIWRLREFALERLPSARGRLPVPRRRAREPEATSASSRSPRSATSRRCATSDGRITALPELERMVRAGVRGDALLPVAAARRASACTGTGCCSTPGRRSTSQPAEASAVINRFARMSAGLGLEMVQLRAAHRRRGPRAAHVQPRGPRRHRRARRPADAAAAAARRGRAADHLRAPPRARAPGRDRQAARTATSERARPRRSTASSSRSTGRPRPTRASIVVGLIRNRHRAPPRGDAARRAARRPDARRSARWPSRSARA